MLPLSHRSRPVRTGRLKCPLTAVISNNWPSLLVTPAKTFESVQIFRLQRLASCGRRIGLAAIRKRGRSAYGKYRSVTHDCSSSSRVSARSLNTAPAKKVILIKVNSAKRLFVLDLSQVGDGNHSGDGGSKDVLAESGIKMLGSLTMPYVISSTSSRETPF
jgi:hypothetical protein